MEIPRYLFAALFPVLAACGGGGGGGAPAPNPNPTPPPTPSVLSGQFKDANTAGLTFTTASRSGTTDASGTFSYTAGETVEFSVGGVVIGSSAGQPVLTPVDLVAAGSIDLAEVQNIARFLLMLDENDDPTDGISISTNVRQAAANWAQVDFTAADFDNEVVTIVSDVASVDSRAASLSGAAAARDHLAQSVHCVMSGFFRGRFTGARTDIIVLVMNPATGVIAAFHSGAPSNYESTEAVSVDQARTFTAPSLSGDGNQLEGQFDSYDRISGVYSINGSSGNFTAERRLPDPTATYRFSGRYYRNDTGTTLSGPLVLNVDAQGTVRVEGYDVALDNTFSANGTYLNNEFEYDYGDGQRQYGTADANLAVVGNGSTVNGNPRPWFAQGCRLN